MEQTQEWNHVHFEIQLLMALSRNLKQGCLVVSPCSIELLLLMLLEGARHETSKQIGCTLSLPRDLLEPLVDQPWRLDRLRDSFPERFHLKSWPTEKSRRPFPTSKPTEQNEILDNQPIFRNSLWLDHQYVLNEGYEQTLSKYYSIANAFRVDFVERLEQERCRINQWVSQSTQGQVVELLSPGDIAPGTVLVLINTVFFRGKWRRPFCVEDSRPLAFHRNAQSQERIPMMVAPRYEGAGYLAVHRDGTVFTTPFDSPGIGDGQACYPEKGYQVLDLPFEDDSLSLMVVLPTVVDGVSDLLEILSAEMIKNWSQSLQRRIVEITLPKFNIQTEVELRDSLQQLGMKDAFDVQLADFSGMAVRDNARELFLSKIVHQTTISIDETGTEAAAATASLFAPTGARRREVPFVPRFAANRAFLYFIRNQITGDLLFAGHFS